MRLGERVLPSFFFSRSPLSPPPSPSPSLSSSSFFLPKEKKERRFSSQEPELLAVLLRQADQALHLLRVDADRLAKLLDDWRGFVFFFF